MPDYGRMRELKTSFILYLCAKGMNGSGGTGLLGRLAAPFIARAIAHGFEYKNPSISAGWVSKH